MNFFLSGIPRVVSRRGSASDALENSFEGLDRAESEGAEGFLVDARLTSDGEAVALGEPEVVLRQRRVQVSSLCLQELREAPVLRGSREGTVELLRDLLERYGSEGRFLVELRSGPAPRPGLLEYRVASLLTQLRLLSRTLVICSSSEPLRRIREIQPGLETALVFDSATPRPAGRLWPETPTGCRSLAANVSVATERLVSEASAAGLHVHVLGVDAPDEAVRLASAGAASLTTDSPAAVLPAIRASRDALLVRAPGEPWGDECRSAGRPWGL